MHELNKQLEKNDCNNYYADIELNRVIKKLPIKLNGYLMKKVLLSIFLLILLCIIVARKILIIC